jgi:hypothetical protein
MGGVWGGGRERDGWNQPIGVCVCVCVRVCGCVHALILKNPQSSLPIPLSLHTHTHTHTHTPASLLLHNVTDAKIANSNPIQVCVCVCVRFLWVWRGSGVVCGVSDLTGVWQKGVCVCVRARAYVNTHTHIQTPKHTHTHLPKRLFPLCVCSAPHAHPSLESLHICCSSCTRSARAWCTFLGGGRWGEGGSERGCGGELGGCWWCSASIWRGELLFSRCAQAIHSSPPPLVHLASRCMPLACLHVPCCPRDSFDVIYSAKHSHLLAPPLSFVHIHPYHHAAPSAHVALFLWPPNIQSGYHLTRHSSARIARFSLFATPFNNTKHHSLTHHYTCF